MGFLGNELGFSVPALGVAPYSFGTCFVTSLGMMGWDTAWAPPVSFAHVPMVVGIGAVVDKVVPFEGQPAVRAQYPVQCMVHLLWHGMAWLCAVTVVCRSAPPFHCLPQLTTGSLTALRLVPLCMYACLPPCADVLARCLMADSQAAKFAGIIRTIFDNPAQLEDRA